jgi:hypothetical protein
MGRVNKTIDGVFTDIVGTSTELSSYDQFIKHGEGNKFSKELDGLVDVYKKLITEHKSTFELLASLEEIIMQMRIRENLSDIKLSQVREYVYARTPFYRKDRKSKDVRVIVGNLEFYPQVTDDIDVLLEDVEFVNKAKTKLIAAMDSEIEENIRLLKSTYGM